MSGVFRRVCAFVLGSALTVGLAVAVPPAVPAAPAKPTAAQPRPEAFGPNAAKSQDLAIDGWGDTAGYHLEVGRESAGFAWHEVAVVEPAGMDAPSWTGYQCLSGDGKYAAVAVLPTPVVNQQAARDHGAFAYSVELATGKVMPIAAGVGLKYYSPGCGAADTAVFTLLVGDNDENTELLTADLATGKVAASSTTPGQVTSAVPTGDGVVGVLGGTLVGIDAKGAATRVATLGETAYDLRPAADGGVTFLTTGKSSPTATVRHEKAGKVVALGSGPLKNVQLFAGRNGSVVVAGADKPITAAGLRSVSQQGLDHAPASASLDGDALIDAEGTSVLATTAHKKVADAQAPSTAQPVTDAPGFIAAKVVAGPKEIGSPLPQKDAAPTAKAASPNAQSPLCAVPRLDPNKQVMQPNAAQVDWAVQLAEQGQLTAANGYSRPAGFDNLGLVAYAPNDDFPLIPLSHPSGGSGTVPRSVMEAIMAQESNWSQASWHSPAGTAGDPLIADYYGAQGDIVSINYAGSDCGYGLGQVTTGMHVGDGQYSAHGQIKIAVDYQENIAAALQILESTWNSLYSDGIIANNGDPKYLENWYFAAWAYNSGIQPTAKYNSTGCTPGPNCTGPDGTWGLGWTNNPDNLDYPPNRDPYLQDTYADAAHPGNWPYEERVLGWMSSPLLRYGSKAYAKPTYNGGKTWTQAAPFASFCSVDNHCDPNATNPSEPGASHCMLNDFECWWHQPVTWIPSCATTCATSGYAVGAGSHEPANPSQNPPTCSVDGSKVPGGSIIVDDLPSPTNLQGCGGPNWSQGGTFSYSYGTNSAGDPIGSIDTHQVGTGLGGRVLFTHTENGSNPSLINTGTWTPNLPSLQYYKIKLHIPGLGAEATNVVYTINPGGGVRPWKIRVNQAWNSEQWVTIGTFAMENGANVVLTNNGSSQDHGGFGYSDFDVAYDAIAFVPQGGTPGQPIGGPLGVIDAPRGSNPAFIACGCARRTAGDPVDTSTGYFGQEFTDLSTPGRGMPLAFTRSYAEGIADPSGPNGSLAADGPFGWGWTYSYNLSATTAANGNVAITQEDGSQVAFVDSSGTYTTAAPRFDATLTKNGSNYVYTRRGKDIFTFDAASGRLIAETDLAGSKANPPYQTSLAYDGAGHLSTVTDPAGRKYTLTWTGSHITGLADQTGRRVSYSYDGSDNLTDAIDVAGGHAQYGYNAAHLMTSLRTAKNFGGAATTMVYDSAERVTSQTDPNGHITTFGYQSGGQVLVTDPAGHQTLDTYQNGLLVSETKGYGTADAGTTTYTYDPVTLGISSTTDPDGNLQTFTYDDHGNRTSASNSLGSTTDYAYDNNDDLIETIDPNGVATVTTYDPTTLEPTSSTVTQANNVVESTTGNFGPAPTRTAKSFYDDAAHPADLTRSVDANGKTTTTAYDAFGDKASVTDPAGEKTQYGYNTATGWLTSTTQPKGKSTTFDHDQFGSVTKVTDPLGHITSATYDADENKTSTKDANGQVTGYAYDPADQLVKVTQADNTTQITDYNADGTIADFTDGLGGRTSYGYDSQGRRTVRTDPDNRATTTHLDAAGRISSVVDAAGRSTGFGYDTAGRPTSETFSDGVTPNVSYTYDQVGQRLSMTDGTGTSTWAYDTFGEITAQTQGSGVSVSFGYDNAGNQTSITYPGHTTPVARTFDDAERLKTVTDWNGNRTTFGYAPDGQVTSTAYPDGVTVTNSYDDNDLLTGTTAGSALSASYGRDPVGQASSRTVAGVTQNFGYSPREQLTSAGSTSFAYDAANNPVTVGGTTQTFDAAGQLTGDTFDALGERTKAGAATYGYNQAGQLTSYAGANSATYAYNGDGTRTSKTTGGATTTFVWDNSPTQNLLSDGTNAYLYGPGGLPIEQIGAASYWFVHDQVGSTIGLLDSTGAVAASYSYSPYGTVTATGSASTPLRYTGQYTDAESGLLYLRARYYDPGTALFLTLDPMVDTTRAPYVYSGDNPANYTDPTGKCSFWSCLGEGLMIAGIGAAFIGCAVLEPCGGLALAGVGAVSAGAGMTMIGVGAVSATAGAAMMASGGSGPNWDFGGDEDSGPSNLDKSQEYAHRQDNMDHVFRPVKNDHKLGPLVESCGGSEDQAMTDMINSVGDVPDGIYGKGNEIERMINGHLVHIRGRMLDGVFKIGTAFTP